MIIIGLDVAQNTGWAFFDTARTYSAIQAGTLKAEGDAYEDKAASLGRAFGLLLKETGKPDLVAIERPIRTQPGGGKRTVPMMGEDEEVEGGSGLNAVISSNQLVGALSAICGWKSIQFITIAPATWRSRFLGKGFKPQMKVVKKKGKEILKPDWKGAVRDQCARERIVVTNNDMADAVGIAVAAKASDEFKMLQYERSRRAA